MSCLFSLYRHASRLSKPLLRRLLSARARQEKEDLSRLGERMGASALPRPNGTLVWLHAASVGEAQSALVLIEKALALRPDISVLVTTGTVTSADLMAKRLPHRCLHQYMPVDHPAWVNGFLDHWRPDVILWMESELWPNMLTSVAKRSMPAILVNARMSDTSFRNWRFAPDFSRKVLAAFTLVIAQTDKDSARYKTLGAQRVLTGGNIKYSAAPLPVDRERLARLEHSFQNRPRWVYASTHDGEEALACRVHARLEKIIPGLLTVIVPRHPNRRHDILKCCEAYGLACILRGETETLPTSQTDIYIADTLGELGLFYSACPVAVIGRSFSKDGGGGHNPLEAAQFGCTVLTGPNNQYQEDIYNDMERSNAVIRVSDEDRLINEIKTLLQDSEKLASCRQKSSEFAQKKSDVVVSVMDHIAPYIMRAGDRHDAA